MNDMFMKMRAKSIGRSQAQRNLALRNLPHMPSSPNVPQA